MDFKATRWLWSLLSSAKLCKCQRFDGQSKIFHTYMLFIWFIWPALQIPQCTRPVPHNTLEGISMGTASSKYGYMKWLIPTLSRCQTNPLIQTNFKLWFAIISYHFSILLMHRLQWKLNRPRSWWTWNWHSSNKHHMGEIVSFVFSQRSERTIHQDVIVQCWQNIS